MTANIKRNSKILLLLGLLAIYATLGVKTLLRLPEAQKTGTRHHINQLQPPFDYLIDLSNKKLEADNPKQLKRFITYYKYLQAKDVPENQMQEILAFCHYYMGDRETSIKLYRQAIQANPNFFWSHYNLGLALLSQNNIEGAEQSLVNALNVSSAKSFEYFLSSKAYLQYVLSEKIPIHVIAESLKKGYPKAAEYLQALKLYDSIQDQNQKADFLKNLQKNIHLVLF